MAEQTKGEGEVKTRRWMSDGSLHNGSFYLPVGPGDRRPEWNKVEQTSRDDLPPWGDAVMEGRGEEREAVPCVRDVGKTPERSLRGVRTTLNLQMAACKHYAEEAQGGCLSRVNRICCKVFEGICVLVLFFSPSFAIDSLTKFKAGRVFQEQSWFDVIKQTWSAFDHIISFCWKM